MRLLRALPLIAAILSAAVPVWSKATVREIDYKGWKHCYELSNSLVRVVLVPQIGGRIMEYSLNGDNVLWQNPAEVGRTRHGDLGRKWPNHGGYKAWNAPQSRWRSPDYEWFYDYAPARVSVLSVVEGAAGVRVECSPMKHLGFRFVREIRLSGSTSHVRVTETMENVSDTPIEWSVWEVTQVNAPCWVAFPANVTEASPQGWRKLLGPEFADPGHVERYGSVAVVEYTGAVHKVGSNSGAGWMACLKGRTAYVKRWTVAGEPASYPDDGFHTQVFTSDRAWGSYMEMEVLGPMTRLKPGEHNSLVEDWYLARLDAEPRASAEVISSLKDLQRQGLLPRNALSQ